MEYNINEYVNDIARSEYKDGYIDALNEVRDITKQTGQAISSEHGVYLLCSALIGLHLAKTDRDSYRIGKYEKEIKDLLRDN